MKTLTLIVEFIFSNLEKSEISSGHCIPVVFRSTSICCSGKVCFDICSNQQCVYGKGYTTEQNSRLYGSQCSQPIISQKFGSSMKDPASIVRLNWRKRTDRLRTELNRTRFPLMKSSPLDCTRSIQIISDCELTSSIISAVVRKLAVVYSSHWISSRMNVIWAQRATECFC